MHVHTNMKVFVFNSELLSEYGREREAISDLRELASSLEAELRNLTLTFTQAAQTLSDCYQTP